MSGGYNFAYLDEQTKRMIRRAILKAIAIPGYQVPFASREMPMPYGWGTGGVQVTAAVLGPDDVLKVIDQGADDTTNAVSIRKFFEKTAGVATTTSTAAATVIQTRHRVPEQPLAAGQILVYQVPIPEPLRFLEPRETETRKLHALEEYGLMYVKLYEDISRHGHIATTYAYPVSVAGRYVMDPSPIPKFDNPKMHRMAALQLFGAGREKRIYALPPHTEVRSLDFEDHPFRVQSFSEPCALCGGTGVYLDEVILDDRGRRMFVCSDTDFCEERRNAGHRGAELAERRRSLRGRCHDAARPSRPPRRGGGSRRHSCPLRPAGARRWRRPVARGRARDIRQRSRITPTTRSSWRSAATPSSALSRSWSWTISRISARPRRSSKPWRWRRSAKDKGSVPP